MYPKNVKLSLNSHQDIYLSPNKQKSETRAIFCKKPNLLYSESNSHNKGHYFMFLAD